MNQKSNNRIGLTMVSLLLVLVVLLAYFGYSYLYLPFYTTSGKMELRRTLLSSLPKETKEGSFLDRNGSTILENGIANQEEAESFAWLLGYYRSDASKEYKQGLRGNLVDYTRLQLDQNKIGASVHLTIDAKLQNLSHDLLNHREGSIIVLKNSTAEVMAFASQSTFDFSLNDLSSLSKNTAESSQFHRGVFETDPPGSTFKVITAISALENSSSLDLNYLDTGEYIPSDGLSKVVNFQNKSYGSVNLEKALNYSINTYFAHLGERLGPTVLEECAHRFLLGKDIEIPFLTTLHSKIQLNGSSELSASAYGQGKTQMTPFHLAMIAQSLGNQGKMIQPFIVSKIISNQQTVYHAENKVLSTVSSPEVIHKLNPYLQSTARKYGLRGEVYAKTGTAELGNGKTHIYLIAYTPDYSFCISLNNESNSLQLVPLANQILKYLKMRSN